MTEPIRWAGYQLTLPGATQATVDRLITRALSRGMRIECRPDGSAVAWRPGGGRYVLDARGKCCCPAATAGLLCSHRSLLALVRAISHEPRPP